MTYSAESYTELDLSKLSEIWEPRKEYIDKDLWVIRNFLTEQELAWLNEQAKDPDAWYPTMRSPYGGNIRNKFLGYIPDYDEDGRMLVPNAHSKFDKDAIEIITPIERRIASVVPKHYGGAGALQSFFEVSEDDIVRELGKSVEYAMDWHYERDDSDDEDFQKAIVISDTKQIFGQGKLSAAFNVYINDDFDGGVLEFRNKDYSVMPEPGMLVNVPLYKEFEHRVTKVTNGNRHTIYGRSWDSADTKYFSTNEDC